MRLGESMSLWRHLQNVCQLGPNIVTLLIKTGPSAAIDSRRQVTGKVPYLRISVFLSVGLESVKSVHESFIQCSHWHSQGCRAMTVSEPLRYARLSARLSIRLAVCPLLYLDFLLRRRGLVFVLLSPAVVVVIQVHEFLSQIWTPTLDQGVPEYLNLQK